SQQDGFQTVRMFSCFLVMCAVLPGHKASNDDTASRNRPVQDQQMFAFCQEILSDRINSGQQRLRTVPLAHKSIDTCSLGLTFSLRVDTHCYYTYVFSQLPYPGYDIGHVTVRKLPV